MQLSGLGRELSEKGVKRAIERERKGERAVAGGMSLPARRVCRKIWTGSKGPQMYVQGSSAKLRRTNGEKKKGRMTRQSALRFSHIGKGEGDRKGKRAASYWPKKKEVPTQKPQQEVRRDIDSDGTTIV